MTQADESFHEKETSFYMPSNNDVAGGTKNDLMTKHVTN